MGQTPILITSRSLTPRTPTSRQPTNHSRGCPFASNCTCVFSAGQADVPEISVTDTALDDARVKAEVRALTDLGWRVTTATDREVLLQRRRGLSFCANLLLSAATGLLWLAYWIPRLVKPTIDTRLVILSADGDVSVVRDDA